MSFYRYKAVMIEATDGDTIKVLVDLGFSAFRIEKIRIKNINAPEKNKADQVAAALASKSYLETHFPEGTQLFIETVRDKRSFNRYVADVFTLDGTNIGDVMVENNHAVRVDYD